MSCRVNMKMAHQLTQLSPTYRRLKVLKLKLGHKSYSVNDKMDFICKIMFDVWWKDTNKVLKKYMKTKELRYKIKYYAKFDNILLD